MKVLPTFRCLLLALATLLLTAGPALATIRHAPPTDALENHIYGIPYRPLMEIPGSDPWDEPWNILLMLVSFPDMPPISTPDYFVDMLFGSGDDVDGPSLYAHPTMADLYGRMSHGAFTFAPPEVVGWVEAPHPYTYYTGYPHTGDPPTPAGCYGIGTGSGLDTGAWLLLRDLLDEAVAQGIDLARFDNDGDGTLDGLLLVHSGYGAEQRAHQPEHECEPGVYAGDIWSHQFGSFYSNDHDPDDSFWVRYVVGPEKSSSAADGLSKVGVWAHEFGHLLRLPDLYALREEGGLGIGCWDLMGYGIRSCAENFQGDRGLDPNEFSAWTRKTMDWHRPIEVTANVCNRPVDPLVKGGESFKVTPDPAYAHDYFLIEYRAQVGPFEEDLPGDRVCVWHVDERKAGASRVPNDYVCMPNHEAPGACGASGKYYGVSLVQPDGAYSLERGTELQSGGHCMGPHSILSSADNYDLHSWHNRDDIDWSITTGALGERARISVRVDDDALEIPPAITSQPAHGATRGQTWAYQPVLEGASGLPDWTLLRGPEGMQIDRVSGSITWDVPADWDADDVQLVIRVANCGGSARQDFYLGVYDEVDASGLRWWSCSTSGGAGPAPFLATLLLLGTFFRGRSSVVVTWLCRFRQGDGH